MRLRFILIIATVLVLASCGDKDVAVSQEEALKNLQELLKSEDKLYQDLTISSKYKNRKMSYSVWLPGGYDASKEYPFLYLLHGYESGDQTHLDRYWVEKGNAREIARSYLKKGGDPMVIIMPNGLSDFYIGYNDRDYEKYFHEELMPEVERAYRCNGKRAIAGLSMGGFGTLYYALSYPEKFTYAYAMSPATSMSGLGVDLVKMTDMAKALSAPCPSFTIEVGEQDMVVNNADSKTLCDAIKTASSCEWISRAGTHDWKFWQECLPKALLKANESFK